MADAPSTTPRPVLKGRHAKYMKKHLAIGIISSLVLVYATKVLVNDKRKEAYAKFYRNYDIDAHFHEIRNAGYFQSCAPDHEEE